jgi:hypothetical protein
MTMNLTKREAIALQTALQLMNKKDQKLQEMLLNISYDSIFNKLEDYVNAIEETGESYASVR